MIVAEMVTSTVDEEGKLNFEVFISVYDIEFDLFCAGSISCYHENAFEQYNKSTMKNFFRQVKQ